ncbi:hypothetical protein [Bradyrhizobium sp. LMG 9283]|uniref:hypothetical protein n=1 Tax=Bradyrhizobium sp. LMG 9283 TaxID=592064 RepID=UPI00388FB91C
MTDVQAAAAEAATSRDEVLTDRATEDGQGQHEDGQQAVSRTRTWRGTGDLNEPLRPVVSVPDRLVGVHSGRVRRLNVDDNQLNSLPETLPGSLERLYVSNNRLTSLPELSAGLRRLYAISNGLTRLPAELPLGLRRLNVNNNQLTDLPEPLPAELEWLSASHPADQPA